MNHLDVINHAIEHQESALCHNLAVKVGSKLIWWSDMGIVCQLGGICPDAAHHAQSERLATRLKIVALNVIQVGCGT
jgi:hypothetical protein